MKFVAEMVAIYSASRWLVLSSANEFTLNESIFNSIVSLELSGIGKVQESLRSLLKTITVVVSV